MNMMHQATIEDPSREDCIAYIKERLGPDLAGMYEDAIRSAISTGSYDHDWRSSDIHPKIAKYVSIIYQDWLSRQGDISQIIVRVQHLLCFGSEDEQAQLKKLLKLDDHDQAQH